MSLVDQSVVPFQQAYPLIIVTVILVLAGNTGFVRHLHSPILCHVLIFCAPAHLVSSVLNGPVDV